MDSSNYHNVQDGTGHLPDGIFNAQEEFEFSSDSFAFKSSPWFVLNLFLATLLPGQLLSFTISGHIKFSVTYFFSALFLLLHSIWRPTMKLNWKNQFPTNDDSCSGSRVIILSWPGTEWHLYLHLRVIRRVKHLILWTWTGRHVFYCQPTYNNSQLFVAVNYFRAAQSLSRWTPSLALTAQQRTTREGGGSLYRSYYRKHVLTNVSCRRLRHWTSRWGSWMDSVREEGSR